MKKLLTTLSFLLALLGTFSVAYATTFNSAQVGATPSNGLYLKTDGTNSTWATVTAASASSTLLTDNNTFSGLDVFGNTGGVYLKSAGSGVGGVGFNSTPDGSYLAGVSGYGALMQLAPSTGVFTMYSESNVTAGSAHAHTITMQWDGAGNVFFPQGFVSNASTTIGTLHLGTVLSVANGGTGAATLTGCLTGNGTGAITGSGTCNTSNATVSSVGTTWPIAGGTITTTGTITWNGLATTSQPASSNLFVSDGGKGMYGVATSSATVSSPLTGAITVVGTGQTIGIQNASASQGGAIQIADFNRLYTPTTTFSAPFVYTLSTNAVTCTNASSGVTGCLTGADWNTFNSKTSFGSLWTLATTFGTTTRATTTPEWFQTGFYASSTAGAPSQADYLTMLWATSTQATTTSLAITALKSSVLATNAAGGVIATTSVGNNFLVTSGVSAGTYNNANITVNDRGIVTSAAAGSTNGFPFVVAPSYGVSTSTIVGFTSGLMSLASTTIGGASATTTVLGPLMVGNLANSAMIQGTTTMLQVSNSYNGYLQALLWNTSSGANASTDLVFNNNLSTATNYYADFGINGGGFNGNSFTGERPNDLFESSSDGGIDYSLASSTASNASSSFRWLTKGALTGNIRMELFNSGLLNVTNASSTNFTVATSFGLPSAAIPSLTFSGQAAVNTTQASTSLRYYDGTATRSLFPDGVGGLVYSSSSLAYSGAYGAAGTTTIKVLRTRRPLSLIGFYCETDIGTAQVTIGNGTASTSVQCSTSAPWTTSSVTWTINQVFFVAVGTIASAPNLITISPDIRKDSD